MTVEHPAGSGRWLWWLSRVAILLFLAAVVGLLWLSERTDAEGRRATLISDILWLEQDMLFHLERNVELLTRIGPEHAANPLAFEPHARALLANETGLVQVRWLDSNGTVRQALPPVTNDAALSAEAVSARADAFRLASSTGKPFYTPPYREIGDDWQFDVHVPVFGAGRLMGVALGTYSVRRLLDKSVPWWLTERYRVSLVDLTGRVLGSRSKVEATRDTDAYQIPFDPPGHGVILQATPYQTPTAMAGRLLSLALVLLAGLVLWSLWALRRHIHRRLEAEHALREEHAFRKAMEDSLLTGLRARDLDGCITYVNPAFCAMVGWSAEELVGRAPPMPYWVDEDIEATRALHDRILAGEGPERGFDICLKRRNGEIFPALIHEAPLIDAQGRHTGWMSSVIDVSEQKRAEELARQQQERLQATARLVTMGEMASSLAHEINQPLAAIASYNAGCLNLLDSRPEDLTDIKGAIAKSMEQAQRAGRIIRRIYEFVRRAEPKSAPCTVTELLDETISLADADARRHGIVLVKNIPAGLPALRGDRVLLVQALLNLVRNALDALRDAPADRRRVVISAAEADGQILFSVADWGPGIPAETAARLFEPFFTTKMEGMGMGLNICRSVVEGHHGRLWFEPHPDGGSIFHMLIPPAQP